MMLFYRCHVDLFHCPYLIFFDDVKCTHISTNHGNQQSQNSWHHIKLITHCRIEPIGGGDIDIWERVELWVLDPVQSDIRIKVCNNLTEVNASQIGSYTVYSIYTN